MLLTCAWVLWQTTFGGGRTEHNVVGTYDTKAACDAWARDVARAAANHVSGTVVGGYAVQMPGQSWVFRCLPDTVRP
jgi:hypothetical protein